MKMMANKEETEEELEVYFSLHQDGCGVVLRANNNRGSDTYNILRIKNDGTLSLIGSVSGELGLKLDHEGQIRSTYPS